MNLRIGLLGVSTIAETDVVWSTQQVDGVELVSAGARSEEPARQIAERWSLPTATGSYEALLASDVDAVYVGGPVATRPRWAARALAAGKHVLVESPLANNAEDAERLVEAAGAADDLVAMEALHWRYHPLAEQVRRTLQSGALGPIEHVEAALDLAGELVPPSDVRWDLASGGGALLNLGCHAVSWCRFVVGSEPSVTWSEAICPVPQVDGEMTSRLSWLSGATGTISSSMVGLERSSRLMVRGSAGAMEVTGLDSPEEGAEMVVEAGGERRAVPVPTSSSHVHQLTAFRDAVLDGAAFPTTVEDGVANLTVIDDCYRVAGLAPRPSPDSQPQDQ